MAFSPKRAKQTTGGAINAAKVIVPLILQSFHPQSVVDIGCGTGGWLSVFKKNACNILGFDGTLKESSYILPSEFRKVNLKESINVEERFDLAICLEVAEHLPEESSDILVESLTNLSDVVIFSAAIPHQYGTNHINEQWPSYWAKKFKSHDYVCVDFIRQKIWKEDSIPFWYRQNLLYFCKNVPDSLKPFVVEEPLGLVHPDLYISNSQILKTLQKYPILMRLAHLIKSL